ncbi:hypothetical protein SDC9_27460 [bioreactor metagenome]|uniref:L,D-TPase catalytic domain-containing protein n=1 Tax=bioreactor metagenome TaxID=1076179 RepID=A0A644US58_9ZZZZ|nr:L,D-transpeptidase family protein [Negativicutes bacterium]
MPVFILPRAVYTALFLLLLLLPVYGECAPISSPRIVINLPSRMLELYSESDFVKEYPVAIGKPSTPTPMGDFSIINKEVDPVWIPPRKGYVVYSGPDNPLGYRWMGFLPLYGIHGTNAPWAIGLAVSNGCVRMHEEDAEELFDIVSYGTPVRVAYDRVKVRFDDMGQISVGIYPDIYGYKAVSVAEVSNRLADYGVNAFVSESFIEKLIEEEGDRQVTVARVVNVKVNDRMLSEHAIESGDVLYVPVWAVAGALDVNIAWDEIKQVVRAKKNVVPGVVKGDVLYVSAQNLKVLLGGQQLLNTEENHLDINILSVVINDKLITRDVQFVDGVLALPVLQLSEALGKKVVWDPSNGLLMMKDKGIPFALIDNQPYIQINKINEYFNAFVFWNQQDRKIEITYPLK